MILKISLIHNKNFPISRCSHTHTALARVHVKSDYYGSFVRTPRERKPAPAAARKADTSRPFVLTPEGSLLTPEAPSSGIWSSGHPNRSQNVLNTLLTCCNSPFNPKFSLLISKCLRLT